MIQPNKLRRRVLDMLYDKQSGHIGGSFSLAEIIAYLYSNYDFVSPSGDKIILSKGHSVPILYAVLHEMGLLTDDDMKTFRECDSRLQGHPDKLRLPLMHATTGSLGQGISIAIGHALAMKNSPNHVFCILGDGEMQEGQIWEALMFAPPRLLSNLTCFVDRNGGQGDGYTKETLDLGDLKAKVQSFGWEVYEIDGHDLSTIEETVKKSSNTCKFVILNTVKGKGVSFMEHPSWHSKNPTKDEYEKAIGELENG